MENKIVKRTLKNGLVVYFYQDNTKHTAMAKLIVKVGGRDKDFYLDNKKIHMEDGMAHFLEHLLIEHNQYGDLVNLFGEHQMSSNGGTYPHKTEYYFKTAKEFEWALEILVKAINQPVFQIEDIEETKKAIYEEIRMRRDEKGRALFNAQNRNLYKNINYENNLGSLKDIEQITIEQVKMYYQAYYRPENEILVIGGNFDLDKVWKLLERIVGTLPSKKIKFKKYDYHEPKEVLKKEETIKMATWDPIAQIVYKIDISSFTKEDKNKLPFYLAYFCRMNFGTSSKLYEKLIEKKIIYDNISRYFELNGNFIELTISNYTKEKEKFIKAVQDTIKNPVFDEELFQLYKNYEKMDICCQSEVYSYIMSSLITNIILFDKEELEDISFVNNLNMEEFKDLIQRLDFTHYICLYLIDEEEN